MAVGEFESERCCDIAGKKGIVSRGLRYATMRMGAAFYRID